MRARSAQGLMWQLDLAVFKRCEEPLQGSVGDLLLALSVCEVVQDANELFLGHNRAIAAGQTVVIIGMLLTKLVGSSELSDVPERRASMEKI